MTAACLDRVTPTGSADLVDALTNPVPAIVTMSILGIPLADFERYAQPIHRIVYSPPGSPEAAQAMVGLAEMMGLIAQLVGQRRAEPADDLISVLATATDDNGALLPLDHVISASGLVIAGEWTPRPRWSRTRCTGSTATRPSGPAWWPTRR